MDNEQILQKALESLENLHKINTDEKPYTVQRLEAIAKVVERLPWDEVATLSIGWESIENEEEVTILPTLNIVMKEQMS